MTVEEYMKIVEEAAPPEMSYITDNIGLMLGDPSQEVTGVLLCVDLTGEVLKEAEDKGVNLIITHHPVIYNPLKNLGPDQVTNRRIVQAIRQNVTVLSYHTNLDSAPAPVGVNYNLAAALGLQNITPVDEGYHYYGDLPAKVTASDFAQSIGSALDTDVKALYNKGPEAFVSRVGVSCGAYDGEADWISECGCDTLVTGEAKHSEIVDLSFRDLTVYLAGHYATEFPGIRGLAGILPGKVYVSRALAGDGALSR